MQQKPACLRIQTVTLKCKIQMVVRCDKEKNHLLGKDGDRLVPSGKGKINEVELFENTKKIAFFSKNTFLPMNSCEPL